MVLAVVILPADVTAQSTEGFDLRGGNDPFAGGGIEEFDNSATDTATLPVSDVPIPVPPEEESLVQGRAVRVLPQAAIGDPASTQPDATRANGRVAPVQAGTRRSDPDDPFLPDGFRAGSWRVFTRLEQAIGYATNNTFDVGGEAGAFSQTDANVTIRSDLSRHEVAIEADGSLRRAFDSGEENIPEASVAGTVRLDLSDGFTSTLRTGYAFSTEATTSTDLGSGVADRPGIHQLETSGELERSGGKLDLTLRGSLDRTWYENASLASGGVLDQSDRDNNLWRIGARVGYGPTPAIKPFVEAGVGWRLHDRQFDRNGENRDSITYDLQAGLEFDLGEKLTGEIAALYVREEFEDDAFVSIDGFGVSADLAWSPERDTVIGFSADTEIDGSTTAGDSGSVINSFRVTADRRIRDNLAASAFAGVEIERFRSTGTQDVTYAVGAGLEYWISRFLSITGDVEHERFDSARAGASWESTSVRLGVALQR